MPTKCDCEATRLVYRSNNPNPVVIVINETNYYTFPIYVHYIEWCQERLIWIAFWKNEDNKQCLLGTLPKDIINHILRFVGPRRMPHFEKIALFL